MRDPRPEGEWDGWGRAQRPKDPTKCECADVVEAAHIAQCEAWWDVACTGGGGKEKGDVVSSHSVVSSVLDGSYLKATGVGKVLGGIN